MPYEFIMSLLQNFRLETKIDGRSAIAAVPNISVLETGTIRAVY